MLNPCNLAKGVNGEMYWIPDDLRPELLVTDEQLSELRAVKESELYERYQMREPDHESGIRSLGLSFAESIDPKLALNQT